MAGTAADKLQAAVSIAIIAWSLLAIASFIWSLTMIDPMRAAINRMSAAIEEQNAASKESAVASKNLTEFLKTKFPK